MMENLFSSHDYDANILFTFKIIVLCKKNFQQL
nr:MAG TPA: hypothetical protein [Caudoviricetes sp.]